MKFAICRLQRQKLGDMEMCGNRRARARRSKILPKVFIFEIGWKFEIDSLRATISWWKNDARNSPVVVIWKVRVVLWEDTSEEETWWLTRGVWDFLEASLMDPILEVLRFWNEYFLICSWLFLWVLEKIGKHREGQIDPPCLYKYCVAQNYGIQMFYVLWRILNYSNI